MLPAANGDTINCLLMWQQTVRANLKNDGSANHVTLLWGNLLLG